MKFKVGDWVLVFGQIYRVAEVMRTKARVVTAWGHSETHPMRWLAKQQRGFWEARREVCGFMAWSHRGFAR